MTLDFRAIVYEPALLYGLRYTPLPKCTDVPTSDLIPRIVLTMLATPPAKVPSAESPANTGIKVKEPPVFGTLMTRGGLFLFIFFERLPAADFTCFRATRTVDFIKLFIFGVPEHDFSDFFNAFLHTPTILENPQPLPIFLLAFIPVVTNHAAAFSLKSASFAPALLQARSSNTLSAALRSVKELLLS
ncbi:unnamed protein product [Aphis gossypii]|uniref:Uncharacterized protein n=1 Tax=Aphis gossypii TaxID=80765 RepID=A0A9P0IYK0_APHGO|nr:unnamed protein product [Aphis gossypii]